MAPAHDLPTIAERLVERYGEPAWAPDLDPTGELLQSIIGQRTSAANSRRAFAQLRQTFPGWEDLASAEVSAIARAIAPAGLAQRKAPLLREIAVRVLADDAGADLGFLAHLPLSDAQRWLERLPGVGPTTAACVLLFGLHRPAFPVDTGILRVARRLGLVPGGATSRETQRFLQDRVPPGQVYALHVDLIRFSRDLCTTSRPLCAVCPLNDQCDYFASFRTGPADAPTGARTRWPAWRPDRAPARAAAAGAGEPTTARATGSESRR